MTKTFRDWGVHPPHFFAGYESTHLRAPTQPLIVLSAGLSERTGPLFHRDAINALDHDMTRNGRQGGEPIGERIMVSGKVLDERGQPIADTIIELWQANAAGLYADRDDQHDAPLDPNFFGAGRCITDKEGKYLFYSIKPGAYPRGNQANSWRPAHIHFSLCGPSFSSRLITQMYFPGDPLLPFDPIFMAVPKEARDRLIGTFSLTNEMALGYEFNIVLAGAQPTPMGF